jgi:hypothetical protein
MQRYVDGKVVGELDPPIDFHEWLRSEIEYAYKIQAHARHGALTEVRLAWNRSTQAQGEQ